MYMRHLRIFFYIILFVPLLVGYPQAVLPISADCSMCRVEMTNLPSCCAAKASMAGADDCVDTDVSGIPCPHGDLCQGDDTPAVAVVTPGVSRSLEYGMTSSFSFGQYVVSVSEKAPEVRPPPLHLSRVRYILLCSFLI